MERIDSLPISSNTIESFEWTTLQGESKYAASVFLIYPTYSNNAYCYEVLITPKKKGLYIFGMNSTFDRASPLEKLEGPCSKNSVRAYMKLETDMNVNFEFLKQSPDPIYINLDRQRFDEFAGFCFYVR